MPDPKLPLNSALDSCQGGDLPAKPCDGGEKVFPALLVQMEHAVLNLLCGGPLAIASVVAHQPGDGVEIRAYRVLAEAGNVDVVDLASSQWCDVSSPLNLQRSPRTPAAMRIGASETSWKEGRERRRRPTKTFRPRSDCPPANDNCSRNPSTAECGPVPSVPRQILHNVKTVRIARQQPVKRVRRRFSDSWTFLPSG